MSDQDWTVLLIGGGSATGKTTLAEAFASRFRLQRVDVDLLYMVLRRATPPGIAPARLYEQPEAYWAQPVDDLLKEERDFRGYFCRALEVVVAQQYRRGRATVMEGVWLTPSFARQHIYDGFETNGAVRSLFLHEPATDRVEGRRKQRANPWDRQFAPDVMKNIELLRHRLGLEVTRDAEALGLPVLESRPFETLEARALAALGKAT